MLSIDALRELVQHMEWADATVWRSVLAHEGARKDPRLRDLLTHLHLVQRLFLMVWRNEPLLPIRSFGDFAEIVDLRERATSYYPEARAFLATLDTAAMTRGVVMPFVPEQEKRLGTTFGVPTLALLRISQLVQCLSTFQGVGLRIPADRELPAKQFLRESKSTRRAVHRCETHSSAKSPLLIGGRIAFPEPHRPTQEWLRLRQAPLVVVDHAENGEGYRQATAVARSGLLSRLDCWLHDFCGFGVSSAPP